MYRAMVLLLLALVAIQSPRVHAAWVASVAGDAHTCALDEAGNVSCWGENGSGQLGLGPGSNDRALPTSVPGLSGVKALAAGKFHTCAVMQQDGTVRCWGSNAKGQLGLGPGNTGNVTVPTPVPGLGGVFAIAAGNVHTCAATSSGATFCWGANNHGQLGLNDTSDRSAPVLVTTLATVNIKSLTAGASYTCAATWQGGALCWGDNHFGQLGVGDTVDRKLPTSVAGLANGSGVTVVSAGGYHTCAIKAGGKLMCWGYNAFGQIGQGTPSSFYNVPQPVSSSSNFEQVATGMYHTCALRLATLLYCTGLNGDGQLGLGDNEERAALKIVESGNSVTLGLTAGFSHTCSLKADGNLSCWGANSSGQLGLGLTTFRSRPMVVPGLAASTTAGTAALSVGTSHVCALQHGGGAACWGSNVSGELGIYDRSARVSPAPVLNLQSPVALATGEFFSCAIQQGGQAVCWGANTEGQLGINEFSSTSVPGPVSGVTDASVIATGGAHACAVRAGGTVACWGRNVYGQLGRGTVTSYEWEPFDIPNFSSIKKLAAGDEHTCVLTMAGAVFCWGSNADGRLGIDTTGDQSSPIQVLGLANVVSIAAGTAHTCAAKSDGSVWCWGNNYYGQLGVGVIGGEHPTPTQVPGLTNVVQVVAGAWHTCALKVDDSLVCWGSNVFGQLGSAIPWGSNAPVPVPEVATALAISAGGSTTCALKQDKSVMCWGNNYDGQLGSGTLGYARRPRELDHILTDGFDPMESP